MLQGLITTVGALEGTAISTALTAGLNDCVTNTIGCFSAVLPIGLTIFTAKFCYIKGVQFFSSLAKKA